MFLFGLKITKFVCVVIFCCYLQILLFFSVSLKLPWKSLFFVINTRHKFNYFIQSFGGFGRNENICFSLLDNKWYYISGRRIVQKRKVVRFFSQVQNSFGCWTKVFILLPTFLIEFLFDVQLYVYSALAFISQYTLQL